MVEFRKEAIGKVVREIRQEKGQSQEVASGFAGIARSHLSMIESGTKQPNFETLWAIANAFEMQPHELVEKIEEESRKYEVK